MTSTAYQSSFMSSKFRKVISVITLFFFLVQLPLTAFAQGTSINQFIQANPQFVYKNSVAQYYPAAYQTVNEHLPSIDYLINRLKTESPHTLNGKLPVPIDAGGITIFVDHYPIQAKKLIASPNIQYRYVRQQIIDSLNRSEINRSAYGSEYGQLLTLYNNAVAYAKANPSVRVGSYLGHTTTAAPKDMIWPVLMNVNNQQTLVPVLYLTANTVTTRSVSEHKTELLGNTSGFKDFTIENTSVTTGRNSFIQVANNVILNNGAINAGGNLNILAGGVVKLLASHIDAKGNISIEAGGIDAQTLVARIETPNGHRTEIGEITSIKSDGSIVLRSKVNILLRGVEVYAGEEITLGADGNIYLWSIPISSAEDRGKRYQRSDVDYLVSSLQATGAIQLIAGGKVEIDAAKIASSEGHIEILAGMGIEVIDQLKQYKFSRSGKFGKAKINESAYQTVAIRSVLDAGKGIRLHTEFGNIKLKAVDIRSSDGTSVSAPNGEVQLLLTKQHDHYSFNSVKKSTLKVKSVNKGHQIEKPAYTTIVGGFKVEAAQNLLVEYEGDPNLSLDEQIDQISKLEGMEWMAQMRDQAKTNVKVNWSEVEHQYKTWNESSTSLSPAFAAVIAIALTVVTMGAGAAGAGAMFAAQVGAQGALGTAIAAGANAFIVKAGLAVATVGVGGDAGDQFKQLMSDETLKSLAVTMLTAGALAKLDGAAFFSETTETVDTATASADAIKTAQDVKEGINLVKQAQQALTQATVETAANAIVYGSNSDELKKIFVQSLGNSAINNIGEATVNKIGSVWGNPSSDSYNKAIQYIAHAGAGCLLGVGKASLTGDENKQSCTFGASGAVIGEIVADVYKSVTGLESNKKALNDFLKEKGLKPGQSFTPELMAELEVKGFNTTFKDFNELKRQGVDLAKFTSALGAFLAGADAQQVNISAYTAENATQNNAFFLIPVAIGLLKAYDLYVLGKDLKVIYDAFYGEYGNAADGKYELEQFLISKGKEKLISIILPFAGEGAKALIRALAEHNIIPKNVVDRFLKDDAFKSELNTPSNAPVKTKTGIDLSKVEVLSIKDAKRLSGENKGLIFVRDTKRVAKTEKQFAAANFEDSTAGAFSDVLSKRRAVPALRYNHPSPNGNRTNNFVRFDGIEENGKVLIDRKTNITTQSKQLEDLIRVNEAMKQNSDYVLFYEFPNVEVANKAEVIFRDRGIDKIKVRVANQ